MISKRTVLTAFGTIVVLSAVSAEIIKCFQCNSSKDVGCSDLTTADTNSSYYRDCNATFDVTQTTPFCRKTVVTILREEKIVRVVRECGWVMYKNTSKTRCYEVDTESKYEVSCQCFADGCNAAPQRLSRPFSVIFLALAVGFVIKIANCFII